MKSTANDHASDPILVIGAGPAGIVTGYFLQQYGLPYEIIDRANIIASTWASLYPSLRLNTTRYFSHMPGRRFPLSWGEFPTGRQYHGYVGRFADAHRLNITLGVDVSRLQQAGDEWEVTSSRGHERYRNVVIATGRFSNPYTAAVPGLTEFQGYRIHAHDYHGPEPFAGKRVLIVGNGPSGLDIALEIGQRNGPTQPALLSMRTGITLRRRYPLGLSKHAWMLATRWLPERIREPFLDYVERLGFPESALHGIKTPKEGSTSGAVAVRGGELIPAVRRGEVVCVDGPARFTTDSVILTDGSTHAIDAVIVATGYRPALGFLEGLKLDCDDQGWPRRFNSRPYDIDYAKLSYRGTYDVGPAIDAQFEPTRRELRGYPGLFQVGLYYKGKGAMYNFNVEAEITAAQLAQRIAPSANA
ncbi:MAG: NAD(P)/FAD-dependent oxidoreductase [Chloroflexi bacterium]|nr:NAD(P)/FAD-dependent oxidoreductase [Chloroflexota bacterium]